MSSEIPLDIEKGKGREQDPLSFVMGLVEVHQFLEQGPLLDKLVVKVPLSDLIRLMKEYPTLFPPDIQENITRAQIVSITFIRGKTAGPGYAKMKIYVEMERQRVLKIFTTT